MIRDNKCQLWLALSAGSLISPCAISLRDMLTGPVHPALTYFSCSPLAHAASISLFKSLLSSQLPVSLWLWSSLAEVQSNYIQSWCFLIWTPHSGWRARPRPHSRSCPFTHVCVEHALAYWKYFKGWRPVGTSRRQRAVNYSHCATHPRALRCCKRAPAGSSSVNVDLLMARKSIGSYFSHGWIIYDTHPNSLWF